MTTHRPKIIIVGVGFGGLFAARTLANKPVDVLLIDKNNFHTFTPLLYQVATSALDPSEIAYPIRTIFQKSGNIRTLMGHVTNIDYANKQLHIATDLQEQIESYDYLILATGSTPTYYGNDQFKQYALELRTLEDALSLRTHILSRFEQATWAKSEEQRVALTTIVVVGGGATGIETAGAIYELYNHVLKKEFHQEAHRLNARVILLELSDRLLGPYPEKLRDSALKQLKSLGVEVILGNSISEVKHDFVTLNDGSLIPTYTLIWATGVKASSVAELLGVELAKNGRLPIHPTTEVIDRPDIYAAGDMTHLESPEGQPYPMLIPVAQQQGILAANNILAKINGQPIKAFTYSDRGIMATIGRRRAVAWIYNKIQLSGFLAWLAWLGLHLLTLLGFRNRIQVFVNWMWNYFTYDRSVRLILNHQEIYKKPTVAEQDEKA